MGLIERNLVEISGKSKQGEMRDGRRKKKKKRTRATDTVMCRKNKFSVMWV